MVVQCFIISFWIVIDFHIIVFLSPSIRIFNGFFWVVAIMRNDVLSMFLAVPYFYQFLSFFLLSVPFLLQRILFPQCYLLILPHSHRLLVQFVLRGQFLKNFLHYFLPLLYFQLR